VPSDDPAKFVAVILADNEDTWGKIFSANGGIATLQFRVPSTQCPVMSDAYGGLKPFA
jgi:predicted metalloprotease